MKKGLIAMMMALVSFTAFAQRPDANATPEERAKSQTASLTESLKLTEDQQKQVYTLNLERAKKMQEMRNSQNQDRSQMRTSIENFNKELAKVLTPEQQEKYTKMMEERRNNRGGGGGGGRQN
jgi:Spy/CpxP family protein refolding chaperone